MQQKSGGNSGWVGHICGAKEVMSAIQQDEHSVGSDASAILGWVYYFDVLARFTLRHWRTELLKSIAVELGFDTNGSKSCALQYVIAHTTIARDIPTVPAHAHPIIQLLAEVFETILSSSNPQYHTTEYQKSLTDLTVRLNHVSWTPQGEGLANEAFENLELTRLAALVYLERVSRNFSGQSARLESWKRMAHFIIAKLDTCPCPFALFIFGCEACTDEHRLEILNLFKRIEQRACSTRLLELKGLVESAWIQYDLDIDAELEYIQKLNVVLSSRNIVPSFI